MMAKESGNSPTPESVLTLAGAELARAVYRTANALLAHAADAEEVTLDVLVALRKKLGEIEPSGLEVWLQTLPSWLDRVAVSKAKGRARKPKHHSSSLAELAALQEQLEQGSASANEIAARMVKEVLSYLPRRHRFVFLLEFGLGHTQAAIVELTGLDADNIGRTREAVEHKLREYGTHHPMPRAMLAGMAAGVEDNPLRHYIEHYGHPDADTEARILRRFESWLRDDPKLELTADDHSFHDHSFSGVGFRAKDVLAGLPESALTEADTAQELTPEPEPVQLRSGSAGWWLFGVAASLAVLALAGVQWQMSQRLAQISERLDALGTVDTSTAAKGPVLLEPGAFVELANGSRAEPSRDATIELLRNDETGAEFRLTAGSIALHVKPASGAGDAGEWLVHDGRYNVVARGGARFRVIHTSSVPEVEVFDGKVQVRGGLLGPAGVEVGASNYTLATVIRARGDVPIADLMPYAAVDPKELASLATDEIYGRALTLVATDEPAAKRLLREIVDRGEDDWVSELAFEHLRRLVDPNERLPLQVAYAERFPDGHFAEAFAAIACQALDGEAAQTCWTEFDLTYPNSLFGP